jgi:hypothetical protein
MKYLFSFITLIISLQILSICSYAQQYEDVVYLKNGSVIHGIIIENVVGESIKIKTKDGNLFVFKMDEIDKMTKEEIVIKKQDTVKVTKDTLKTKIKEKEILADNSITFQPIGLLTVLSNIEFDHAFSRSFSAGIKFSYVAFLLRAAISFEGNKQDVEEAEATKESLAGWGLGGHLRYYPGARAIESFFLGLAFETLSFSYDEIDNGVAKNQTAGLIRLEFEIGDRIKLSKGKGGFTFLWTLGAGVGFYNKEPDNGTIPLGSIGFGIGYSF